MFIFIDILPPRIDVDVKGAINTAQYLLIPQPPEFKPFRVSQFENICYLELLLAHHVVALSMEITLSADLPHLLQRAIAEVGDIGAGM